MAVTASEIFIRTVIQVLLCSPLYNRTQRFIDAAMQVINLQQQQQQKIAPGSDGWDGRRVTFMDEHKTSINNYWQEAGNKGTVLSLVKGFFSAFLLLNKQTGTLALRAFKRLVLERIS